MNKDIAMKWVKALRSGKYKQGYSALVSGEGSDSCFCCLGVLAVDVLKKDPKELYGHGALPYSLLNDSTLRSNNGTWVLYPIKIAGIIAGSLAVANDCRISFKKIASYIQKNYKNL